MKKNKNNNISKTVTFDEALEDPAYADFHEAILLLKDTPRKDILKKFLPKEYEMFVIEVAMRKMSQGLLHLGHGDSPKALKETQEGLRVELLRAHIVRITPIENISSVILTF